MIERPRTLMWVKGHGGVEGNEAADARAKKEVAMGERMHWPDKATLAGIRQAYPLHTKAPPHLRWSTQAIRGLTYLETDRGPQRQWMREIGKTDDAAACVTDGHRKTQHTCTDVRGWEMEKAGHANKRGATGSGVRRWRGS